MTKHMCCETVATSGMAFYRPKTCGNKAKVEVDGLHYCGTHDPNKVAAKRAERTAKWEEERAKQRKEWALNAAAPDLLAALKAIKCLAPLDSMLRVDAEAAIAKAEDRK